MTEKTEQELRKELNDIKDRFNNLLKNNIEHINDDNVDIIIDIHQRFEDKSKYLKDLNYDDFLKSLSNNEKILFLTYIIDYDESEKMDNCLKSNKDLAKKIDYTIKYSEHFSTIEKKAYIFKLSISAVLKKSNNFFKARIDKVVGMRGTSK